MAKYLEFILLHEMGSNVDVKKFLFQIIVGAEYIACTTG